jgi:hypothetical protein
VMVGAQWALGAMSLVIGLCAALGMLMQLQEPWEWSHFGALKSVVTSSQLVLGMLPHLVCAGLIGLMVMRPDKSNYKGMLVLSGFVGAMGALGWGLAFVHAEFWSWFHLWLPVAPLLHTTVATYILSEVYASREELVSLEKMIRGAETA